MSTGRPAEKTARSANETMLRRSLSFLQAFLHTEAASGVLLLVVVVLALVVANSRLEPDYRALLRMPVEFRFGAISFAEPLLRCIDDGLMAVFFMIVAMEIKREVLEGELSSLGQLALPGLAALGGMIVPAILYVAAAHLARNGIVSGVPTAGALRGWAIPAATDVAFALGALALAGKGVPSSLRLFLLALAILDDLGAILVIALFYSGTLVPWAVLATGGGMLALLLMNRLSVQRLWPYLAAGLLTWLVMLRSGLHPTLAGVAVAFAVPLRPRRAGRGSPLKRLEKPLHAWVAYGIVPLFGFANAGLAFGDVGWVTLVRPVPLGIMAGLCVGKPLGVFGAAWCGSRIGLATWPAGVRPVQLFGVAMLCGIGFTMSLFIGQLAFATEAARTETRLGVFVASLLAGAGGLAILRFSGAGPPDEPGQSVISTKASTSTATPHGSDPTPMALRA